MSYIYLMNHSADQTHAFASGDITTYSGFSMRSTNLLELKAYISPPVVAYTGDSIISGWYGYHCWMDTNNPFYGDLTHSIPYQVKHLAGVTATYKNYSRGSMLYEWVSTVAMREITNDHPLKLVCAAGINDDNSGRSWSDVLTNLAAIRAAWPTTNQLYICEITPWKCNDAAALIVRTWNTNLAVWCTTNNATLIKVHDSMGQIRTSTGQYDDLAAGYDGGDGTHPNQAGINAYAQKVAQYAIEPAARNQIIAPGFLPNGSFSFTIDEIYGRSVTLQTSTNLRDWLDVTNFSGSNTPINFIEPTPPNSPNRFYRAVSP